MALFCRRGDVDDSQIDDLRAVNSGEIVTGGKIVVSVWEILNENHYSASRSRRLLFKTDGIEGGQA